MDHIQSWTREYFVENEEECMNKLKQGLSLDEKAALRSKLNFKECGSLAYINHAMIADIRENEFYCDEYEVKQNDGSVRVEKGKFSDKLNLNEGEVCEDPAKHLQERQAIILTIPQCNNQWIKDCTNSSTNKRKLEEDSEERRYLVKVYDSSVLLLNDFVEVVGFLQPTFSQTESDSMEDEDCCMETKNTSPFVLHAVYLKTVSHNNPLMAGHDELKEQVTNNMLEIRKDLLKLLSQFMFGDELSANYVLYHLISNIYGRVNEEPLGKFSINLICHPIPSDVLSEYVKKFYNILEVLLPNSLYFPITIDSLNKTNFVPKKDYKTNCLDTALLQLPKHTHILLDETKLENGKLETTGCTAVNDLSDLIRFQQLSYDFQFYKVPFKTDIPVLIVSEGKSLLPSDFAIPLIATDGDAVRLINENITAGIHYMKPKLNLFRYYLTHCRLQSFDIKDEETKMIEADFVKLRENSNFQVEHLHSLLVLSRLIGISQGLKTLDASSWETAKQLEIERIARLEKRNCNEP